MIILLFHHLDDEIMTQAKDFLMFSLEIILLGVALAIDAAVVTFAVGLIHLELPLTGKAHRGLTVALVFGVFQAAMVWLGSYVGFLFTFSNYGFFFRMIVGIIFFGLAIKFIQESFSPEEKKIKWGVLPILILAFATSIDAFAAGIGLGTLPQAYLAAFEVGAITSALCGLFYFMSQFFKDLPDRWLIRLGALILIYLGGEIFWDVRNLF